MVIKYCSTDRIVADKLTKLLAGAKYMVFVEICGLS